MWKTIWVVFMVVWLLGGGYLAYGHTGNQFVYFGGSFLLPWVCVLIPGLVIFGAVDKDK